MTSIAVIGAGVLLSQIRRVIIIAPTSVVPVWPKEISQYGMFPADVISLSGSASKRTKTIYEAMAHSDPTLRAFVINYEGVWRDGVLDALKDFHADMIICDEMQRIKNPKATQSKAIHELADDIPYRLGLTGTPIQNEIVDLWSQYRFLDSSVFGMNFYTFRSRYCVMGGFNKKQIIGHRHEDELIRKEYTIALRKTKKECLDLPEQVFIEHPVILSPKERKAYDQMLKDSIVELESGETLTAATVLTRLLRLSQITGGFLPAEEGGDPVPIGTSKLDALKDILEDYGIAEGRKLIIFCNFLAELSACVELCNSVSNGAWKTVCIYGAVSKDARAAAVDAFQTDPDTRVMVGQIDTLALGLTLTAADTCVYYSLNYNFGTYDQSLARIHRMGQKNTCTYIHLLAEHTVDGNIMKALKNKQDLAKHIVDSWRDVLTGGREIR